MGGYDPEPTGTAPHRAPRPQGQEEQGCETHGTVYTCRLAKDGGRRITEASVAMLRRLADLGS